MLASPPLSAAPLPASPLVCRSSLCLSFNPLSFSVQIDTEGATGDVGSVKSNFANADVAEQMKTTLALSSYGGTAVPPDLRLKWSFSFSFLLI